MHSLGAIPEAVRRATKGRTVLLPVLLLLHVPCYRGKHRNDIGRTTVADIQELGRLGGTAVDVRLFGYGSDQSVGATIDNMRRFRDGVLTRI
jgi:hypothetical protein